MDDSIYRQLGGINSSLTRLFLLVGQNLRFIIRAIDIDTLSLENAEYRGLLLDYLTQVLEDWSSLGSYLKLTVEYINISYAVQHNADKEIRHQDLSGLNAETLAWLDLPLNEFTRNYLSTVKQILNKPLDRVLVVKQSEEIMQFKLILTYPDFKSAGAFPGTYQLSPDNVDKQSALIEMGPISHEITGINDEIRRSLAEIEETLKGLD